LQYIPEFSSETMFCSNLHWNRAMNFKFLFLTTQIVCVKPVKCLIKPIFYLKFNRLYKCVCNFLKIWFKQTSISNYVEKGQCLGMRPNQDIWEMLISSQWGRKFFTYPWWLIDWCWPDL
jgi:hypothetical protein